MDPARVNLVGRNPSPIPVSYYVIPYLTGNLQENVGLTIKEFDLPCP
jgi:hypothetical protein